MGLGFCIFINLASPSFYSFKHYYTHTHIYIYLFIVSHMFVPNKGRPDTWHLTPLQAYGTRQPWHSHMSPQSSTQSSSLRTSHVYLLSATLCVMMLLFDRSPRDSEEGCDLLGGEKTCECEKERKLCLFLWFLGFLKLQSMPSPLPSTHTFLRCFSFSLYKITRHAPNTHQLTSVSMSCLECLIIYQV